jgi:predicted DCC family thiol-disulfide oxidoreductase YuxK
MLIIYDGLCPLCNQFSKRVHLQRAVGVVELLDARSTDSRIIQFIAAGYKLDQTLLVQYNGHIYVGAQAMHLIATCSSQDNWFNRLFATVFKHPLIARLLYRPLTWGRTILLRLLGRPRIDQ